MTRLRSGMLLVLLSVHTHQRDEQNQIPTLDWQYFDLSWDGTYNQVSPQASQQ